MKRNQSLTIAAMVLLAIALFAMSACKTSGMALTSRGQLLKINIKHPTDLPESGEDNLDVAVSNRGVNNIKDILVDIELPPQLIVLDQTADRGINVMHDPGSNVYHFTLSNVQPAEDANIRFHVRTAFGTMRETGSVKATAWQRDLPGDKLIETAVIKLRS
ncbi:MAG TPA: hypothetical protein VF980_07235 [Thermoanaerobaculia bacterium]